MNTKLRLLLILALVPFLSVQAQPPEKIGLSLNGTIVSATRQDFKEYTKWSYKFLMVLRNDSKTPVILLKCFPGPCGKTIEFLSYEKGLDGSPVSNNELLVFKQTSENKIDGTFWPWIIRGLDKDQPPRYSTLTIEPGSTFEYNETFAVVQKFWTKRDGRQKTVSWENLDHKEGDTNVPGVPLSEASHLRMSYRWVPLELAKTEVHGYYRPGHAPSTRPYHDPEFLTKLSERWREFGVFPVDSSGSFSITSERIVNGLYQIVK